MTIQELERCIQLYGKDIYSFCMHLTKEKGSADDLYQDTFLEAMKKLAAIRYEDNPKSYLLSVAIRLWKNRVRKLAWRNRIAPQVGETTLEQEGGATPDVSEKAVANEERGMLWKAIDALDDRYRIPLYKEASFKPYVIAAMIMLSKFENPQDTLKKLEVKAAPRIFE